MNDDNLPRPVDHLPARGDAHRELAAPAAPSSSSGFNLRDIAILFWRRKFVLILPTLAAAAVAYYASGFMDRTYKSYSEVLIEARDETVVQFEDVLGDMPKDRGTIFSEVAVLESRGLAEHVVDLLTEDEREELAEGAVSLRDLVSLDTVANAIEQLPDPWPQRLSVLLPDAGEMAGFDGTEEEDERLYRSYLVDMVLASTSAVQQNSHARAIQIVAEAKSPDLAAALANATAEAYLSQQVDEKHAATERARDWLQARVDEMRVEVEHSERAVEAYREKAGLVETQNQTLTSQQLSEINNTLVMARAELAERRAELGQVESRYKKGGVDAAAEVLSSDQIARLRGQEADLRRRQAELTTEFGPKHPKMINLKAEIGDISERIRAEVRKSMTQLRNSVMVTEARVRALSTDLGQLENATADQNTKQVQLRALMREADANLALFETFLTRSKETSARESLQQPDARIISYAEPQFSPSGPGRKIVVAGASAVALALASAFVLLAHMMDTGVRSAEQIERRLGVPSLGLVPMLRRDLGRRLDPAFFAATHPKSAFSEAVRNIHTSVVLADRRDIPRIVVFTSANPGEGKSTLSAGLGRLMAMQGYKVLLVDGDMRKPRQHTLFGTERAPGLAELVRGEAHPGDCIRTETETGLHLIAAGHSLLTGPDIFSMQHTQRVLDALKTHYDLVIVDSPPVSALCDTRILSAMADRTVMVARWGVTSLRDLQTSLDELLDAGADVAGVSINMVDVRKHAQYGFADSDRYAGRYRGYYSNLATRTGV